jgi:hypothetical protein
MWRSHGVRYRARMLSVTTRRTVLGAALLAAGCASNHDDLGQDEGASSATGSAGGQGGDGGGSASGAGGGGGSAPPEEPDVSPSLTVVNGLADGERAAVCLLASPGDPADDATPLPSGGLAFAEALRWPEANLPSNEVELVLVVGSASALDGAPCRALADDPAAYPELAVRSFGVVAAGALQAPRSWLLAFGGCALPGHIVPETAVACGMGYLPDAPDPSLVLAPLSRIATADRVAIQTAHAATPGLLYDFLLRPGTDGAGAVGVAQAVVTGQIAPSPPDDRFSAAAIGVPSFAAVSAMIPNTGVPPVERAIADALSRGGLTSAALANGKNLAFVAVGASPALPTGSAFHAFDFVAIAP